MCTHMILYAHRRGATPKIGGIHNMSNNERELIQIIRESKDPTEALFMAINEITRFLKEVA